MQCREFRDHIIEFVENTCSPETRKRYQEHCDRCQGCAGLVGDVVHLWQAWQVVEPVGPAPDFNHRLFERLAARQQRRGALMTVFTSRVVRPVFATVLIAAAVIIGIRLGSPVDTGLPSPVPFTEAVQYFIDDHYISQFSDFPPTSIGSFYATPELVAREMDL